MKSPFSNGTQKVSKQTAVKLLAAASLFILPACSPADTALEESNVTAEELVEETTDYVGQEVSIRGEVEETVGDSAFLMLDDDGVAEFRYELEIAKEPVHPRT